MPHIHVLVDKYVPVELNTVSVRAYAQKYIKESFFSPEEQMFALYCQYSQHTSTKMENTDYI